MISIQKSHLQSKILPKNDFQFVENAEGGYIEKVTINEH